MFMTKNKWVWEALAALAITTINVWILNHLTWSGPVRLMLAQAWSGMLIVCALAYVAGVLPRGLSAETTPNEASSDTSRCQAWLRIAIWTGCCASAWLTLPAGGSLGLMTAVLFFTLVWMNGPVDLPKSAFRTGFAIAITGVLLLLALGLLGKPWRLARIIADFSGPLDLLGRHYFHGQVLKVLFSLREFASLADSFPEHLSKTSGLELLKFASWAGALPAAFLAALILVGWHRLYRWLQSTPCGAVLPSPLRRLGLALVIMHAATSLLNILWNFGISRQAFGAGQPPLTWNAAWWILSASLVWVLFRVYRQHKLNSADTERNAKRKPWHALAGSTGLAATVVIALVVSVNTAKDEYFSMAPTGTQKYSRLDIVDRDGKTIAETVTAFDLWLIPNEFWSISPANPGRERSTDSQGNSDEERRSRLLNALAEWPQVQSIVAANIAKHGKSASTPKLLAWAIDPVVAKKVSALGLAGLRLVERPARYYPGGTMFAHAIGFTSLSDHSRGQEGLELVANERMRTFAGQHDPAGTPLATALDPEIQTVVNQALHRGIAAYGAIGAAAVVVDARTGEIRAMVSAPNFDPNNRATYRNPYQPERILNRAVAVNFPVGSLLTPLLIAHSLETGRIQATTQVNMSNGQIKIGQTRIFDASPVDSLSNADIIAKSSNVGQAKIAMQLPIAELKDVTHSLGVGEPLGIPGLIGGVDYEHIHWDEWTPGMHAQPGMHIQTNLMQAVKAYLPIANGGELMPVSLLAKNLHRTAAAPRVLSSQTALSVREMLESAASPTGTAPRARVTGIRVAGKSTTISGARQGYNQYVGEQSLSNTISAFVGMAPTEKPQFLVGVMFQFPPGKLRFGGETAAPVFAEIIRQILEPTVPTKAFAIHDSRLNKDGNSDEQQEILAGEIKPVAAGKIAAIGQNRLELAENKELLHTVVKRDGNAGTPLQTTLDPEIQSAAIQALQEGVTAHGAIGGSVVVIEADTGKIRAMLSSPDFNANDDTSFRNPYQPERMRIRARGINFPVGSLLTPLLAAHMIENGRMKPTTTVAIGNQLIIGKSSIVDASPNETLSLAEIVTKSSNIGQAKLALNLHIAELRDVTRHFGIGEPLYIGGLTGCIDFQSIMWSKWTPQMHAQPGLNINTNLLQVMRAYLPLANGGRLGRISLIETTEAPPRAAARVLSDTTVKAMRDILSTVAEPTGTAPLAQLPGVMVTGKTGTIIASNGHPVAAFIGVAPAENPRWLIGVLLEFPKVQTRLVSSTAAPVFASIL